MKQGKGKQTRLSMKQNALVNKQYYYQAYRNIHKMKQRKGKQTRLSMKQNETMNGQPNKITSNNTQSQENKNNDKETNEQRQTGKTNWNKSKDDDINKVSKITDALTVVINKISALKKSIRPPSKFR